jgi:uncharacterized membrane protein (UPF0127 family)
MALMRATVLPFLLVSASLLVGCQASAEKPVAKNEGKPAAAGTKPLEVPAVCKRTHLPQQGLATGVMEIETQPRPTSLKVELCLTEQQRRIGMMCRTEVGDDEGMLFVFPGNRPRSFWMKNTLIALDMVFLDPEGRIVGIVENAEPLTLSSRKVREPAQYVLEIGGGRAKALGLEVGQFARVSGLPDGTGSPGIRSPGAHAEPIPTTTAAPPAPSSN